MNKIVASVGLVALGASGLQAASVPGFSEETPTKPWTVSASLRGFYDDNFNTIPKGGERRDTFGFEVSPSATLAFGWPKTPVNLVYISSFKWYEHKPIGNTDNFDQTHTFNAFLDHAFSERYQATVTDSFVIGQEPDMLRAGDSFATFQRIPGDNIRNYGSISFKAQLTPLLGLKLTYANAYYDYQN